MLSRLMLVSAISFCLTVPTVAQQEAPVPIQAGQVALTPENSRVQFVGTHVGDEPKPRTGQFQKFSGNIQLSPDHRQVTAINLSIETNSLTTPIPDLTNHLKSPDFFETREFPKAIFKSGGVSHIGDQGQVEIEGALTLLGQTNTVVLPGTATVSNDGLVLHATASVDRTQFGMDRFQDRVEKTVTIEVWVGDVPAGE